MKSSDLVATPSKTIRKTVKKEVVRNGKVEEIKVQEIQIRTFLWDNPELRRAFREGQNRAKKAKKRK